jgi:bifunctional non-homologous end joining protein LigD
MAKKKAALAIEGHTLELSNLDKPMFPDSGFTKANVIDYYIRIAKYLLPHLHNRAITLKRYPNGVESDFFYEKDKPRHTPHWVQTFPVPRKNGKGNIDYVLVNDLATLVWSANLANLEMHTFLAKVPTIQRPTFVVFDLDPGPPADILTCAQIALWLREVLQKLKLKCCAKVSGSKGMQIYVPLNTKTDYDETSEFALAVARKLEDLQPTKIVSKMAKELRHGKVFIDWSQNADFKTTVCVYSLRASRETPYVSVPLKWREIQQALTKNSVDSLYFQPPAAIERADRLGDLFEGVLRIKQKLPKNYDALLKEIDAVSNALENRSIRRSNVAALTSSRKATERESKMAR